MGNIVTSGDISAQEKAAKSLNTVKGIKDKKRDGNKVYDEASGDWVPKWGYKGKNKDAENSWLVEVDEKKEEKTGKAHDARADSRHDRKERVRRNERKQRANDSKSRRPGV